MDSRLQTLLDSKLDQEQKDPYAILLHRIKIRKLFSVAADEAYKLIDALSEHILLLDIAACRNKLIKLFYSCRLVPKFEEFVEYATQLRKTSEDIKNRPLDIHSILDNLNRSVEDCKPLPHTTISWQLVPAADFYTDVIEYDEYRLYCLELDESNHDRRNSFLQSMIKERPKHHVRNMMYEYCEKLRWRGFKYEIDFHRVMQDKAREACDKIDRLPDSPIFNKDRYRQTLIARYNGESWDFANRNHHFYKFLIILRNLDKKWKKVHKKNFNRCLIQLSVFNRTTLKPITRKENTNLITPVFKKG